MPSATSPPCNRLDPSLSDSGSRTSETPSSLAGDFNLTAEHPLYRRDWASYRDAFAWAGWGLGHTMFTRKISLRITMP